MRPAGARLRTFGGRASGPEPLEGLFGFACSLFKKAGGRKLTALEVRGKHVGRQERGPGDSAWGEREGEK